MGESADVHCAPHTEESYPFLIDRFTNNHLLFHLCQSLSICVPGARRRQDGSGAAVHARRAAAQVHGDSGARQPRAALRAARAARPLPVGARVAPALAAAPQVRPPVRRRLLH